MNYNFFFSTLKELPPREQVITVKALFQLSQQVQQDCLNSNEFITWLANNNQHIVNWAREIK